MREDGVPLGAVPAAGALAKELRVVDFADLEMLAAAVGPGLCNAAFGDQFFRSAGKKEQERMPVVEAGLGVHAKRSDEPLVEQRGKLTDSLIGSDRPAARG